VNQQLAHYDFFLLLVPLLVVIATGGGVAYWGIALPDCSGEWLHTSPRGPAGYLLGWLYSTATLSLNATK
jgi:hypothetical protein